MVRAGGSPENLARRSAKSCVGDLSLSSGGRIPTPGPATASGRGKYLNVKESWYRNRCSCPEDATRELSLGPASHVFDKYAYADFAGFDIDPLPAAGRKGAKRQAYDAPIGLYRAGGRSNGLKHTRATRVMHGQ